MKTDDLLKVIKSYLQEKDTDFAYMVTGGWGTGKTYFFKNRLPELETKYHIISLFGIEKPQDIYERILESLILGYKWKNSIASRLGAIANIIPNFLGGVEGNINEILTPTDQELKSLKEFRVENCSDLIVFDDFERISSNANMGDILSEIHKLVDEFHNKVILVCNEEKLEKCESYKTFKEKTVRYTISYEVNIVDVLNSYYTNYTKKNKEYVDFLRNNQDDIVDLLNNAANKNLRTLDFIISTFFRLFNFLNKAKFEVCPEAKESFITKIFLYLLICSIEQKKGRNIECINLLNSLFLNFWNNQEVEIADDTEDIEDGRKIEIDKMRNEYDRLYGKYSSDILISFEIVEYVYYGNLPNKGFNEKIDQYQVKYKGQLVSESQKALKRLNDFRIDDDGDLSNILRFLKNGEYSVEDILLIYKIFLYLRELDIFSFDDNDFINAIESKELKDFYILDNLRKLDDWYLRKMTEKSIMQYNDFSANVYKKKNQVKEAIKNECLCNSVNIIRKAIKNNDENIYKVIKGHYKALDKKNIVEIMHLLYNAHSSSVKMFCMAIENELAYIDIEVLKVIYDEITQYNKKNKFKKVFFVDLKEKIEHAGIIDNK